MSDGTLRIYSLAVCFASLMCGAITTGLILFNIVKLLAPEATIDPAIIGYYRSNEAFRNSPFSPERASHLPYALSSGRLIAPQATIMNDQVDRPKLSEEEIKDLRVEQLKAVISNHTFRARQGIIQQAIIILICLVLFLTHWKLTRGLIRKPGD